MRKPFKYLVLIITLLAQTINASAQDSESTSIVIPPLFEYPVAPDSIQNWTDRSTWLVNHFWDNFDFKQKSVGQIPLNHAFRTYLTPLMYANKIEAEQSLNKLIKSLEKNPVLLVQFTKAAQYNCYDTETADQLIDAVYLPFVKALLKNKKVSKLQKARYAPQLKPLENTIIGNRIYSFPLTLTTGEKIEYSPSGKYTLIQFADPSCVQCRLARIKLSSDNLTNKALEASALNVMYVIINPDELSEDWINYTKDYPKSWIVASCPDCEEIIDIRTTPDLYILNPDGEIILKNSTVEHTLSVLHSLLTPIISIPEVDTEDKEIEKS